MPSHTASLQYLPEGAAGTRATLKAMAAYVREYRKNLRVRELALSIVRDVGGHKNFKGAAAAICEWVKSHIQYVRDINEVETVQTPLVTLDYRQGDCDDQATLMAALLEAVGFNTRLRAIKLDPGGAFEHVVAEAQIDNSWVPLETTEDWAPGQFPANVAGNMYEHVTPTALLTLVGFLGFFGLGANSATSLFAPQEIAFLANVWPSIRVAKNWTDIGWAGLGYANGPPLSANSNAILAATWSSVRRAAKFTDINWGAESVPPNLVPQAAPAPIPPPVIITANYNGSPLNSAEYAVIAGVWPTIRGAANWKDISWPSLNYPNGPNLSAEADALMGKLWGVIRAARWFQDINWKAAGYNANPAAQAVPEVTSPNVPPAARATIPEAAPNALPVTQDTPAASNPAAQSVPEITGGATPPAAATGGGTAYDWSWLFGQSKDTSIDTTEAPQYAPGEADQTPTITPTGAPIQAGMFGDPKTMLIMAALSVGAALMFGQKSKRGRKRPLRGRRA